MKVLFAGLGSIGQRHLRNLKKLYGDEFEVSAFRTRRLRKTYSDNMQIREGIDLEDEYNLRVFTDLSEALSERPDIAFITNITSKHLETALICAEAGCHLFIEKPLSDSMEGIKELERIVRDNDLKVFIGFQNRYHVCVQKAKSILDSGRIGAVQSAAAEFSERLTTMHTYEDYRYTYMASSTMGGGPVLNLQIHDLDLLQYLLGEPVNVFSVASKNSSLEIDVEDSASSIYTFRSNDGSLIPVYSHTDFLQFPPAHIIKIVGEKGRIEIDMNKVSIRLTVDGEIINDTSYTDFQRNDMFLSELKDFIECVKENKEPYIGLDHGIVSLKMAIAAKTSSEEKRGVSLEEL